MQTAVAGHSDANCAVPWIAGGTDARDTRRKSCKAKKPGTLSVSR